MATSKPITFATNSGAFTTTLNKRVNDYFKTHQLSRHANSEMVIKTIVMFALYIVPYVLIVTNTVTGLPWLIALVLIMGLGLAGIGLSVMHDANHGAYSGKPWVNTVIGYSLNFVGANAFNWKIQHNLLHHTYTNIHDEDEDISPRGVLRLSPHSKWHRMHQYQFLYAWFLYGLMTLVWMITKDFVRITRYQKKGLIKFCKANLTREWAILLGTKAFYFTYIFLIPLLVTPLLWWQIALGFVIMHFLTGSILAVIFQPAHVIEGTEFPQTDENSKLETNWTIHQLLTTTNFGNKSRWFSWYVGGLNFQIEHHLFPHICHVHYRKIAGIVISTTKEFGLPYKSFSTFLGALASHANLLRQLGRRPTMTTTS
jgi:linoleoyl-CoA desaturase